MINKKIGCTIACVTLLAMLAACGSSSASTENYMAKSAMDSAPMMEEAVAYEDGSFAAYNEGSGEPVKITENVTTSNRKLIRNASLSVETKEFDKLLADIDEKVKSLGGYIEDMSGNYGSKYSSYRSSKSAYITARIPSAKLDEFIGSVGESANITSRSESVKDITLDYVDMESHKKMLKEEQERLMAFLDQAETIEDIITIEDRLAEVKYQIESMESQLRTYDNKVDYSTVTISIDEVIDYTVVVEEEKTPVERMTEGFKESVRTIGIGLREFGIWFVVNIPYIVLLAILAIVAIITVRAVNKRNAKKREALREEKHKKNSELSAGNANSRTEFGDPVYVARPDKKNDGDQNA